MSGASTIGTSRVGWWIRGRASFLFPVKALSPVFRAKYLAGLHRAYTDGTLTFAAGTAPLAHADQFAALVTQLRATPWVVYAKRPFGGPAQVLQYLGRYTHRIAISNARRISLTDGIVRFRWKDYADRGHTKVMALGVEEFLRRFLLHVLPRGFVRIRHFGLLANRQRRTLIARAQDLLAAPTPATAPPTRARPTSTPPGVPSATRVIGRSRSSPPSRAGPCPLDPTRPDPMTTGAADRSMSIAHGLTHVRVPVCLPGRIRSPRDCHGAHRPPRRVSARTARRAPAAHTLQKPPAEALTRLTISIARDGAATRFSSTTVYPHGSTTVHIPASSAARMKPYSRPLNERRIQIGTRIGLW